MPVRPTFEWEQTHEDVFLHITIKGFHKRAVDVFVSDLFAKVNAPPTYLLALDLLHPVDPDASTHYVDGEYSSLLHVKLRKAEPGLIWEALCVASGASLDEKKALLARRAESMQRAEERYNRRLEARGQQRERERRRMTEEQWEVEKQQRQIIEQRFDAEKSAAEQELFAWEDERRRHAAAATQESKEEKVAAENGALDTAARPAPQSPADILASTTTPIGASAAAPSSPLPSAESGGAAARSETAGSAAIGSAATAAPVRGTETVNVTIDFTPKMFAMPTRARGDDEYYRQSRYKPVSVEDSPMFWKERADGLYKSRDWRGSANAYSESIKRDGVFLTCVMNRAACYLHLGEFKRAIEDCTLSLTMLANTPASEITQERYRGLMTKLHARRGAAYCWHDELAKGLSDLRMAAAYRDPTLDEDVLVDVAAVEKLMMERGIPVPGSGSGIEGGAGSEAEAADAARMQEAAALYFKNNHEGAANLYREILATNPYHAQARSNLAATLLQLGEFKQALRECEGVIQFCSEVAEALNHPGALGANDADSDDEDEEEGEQRDAANGSSDDISNAKRSGGGRRGVRLEPGEEEDKNAEEAHAAAANKDDMTRKRRAAARKVSESSGHVYLLLKAYVRASAALCGLKDYHSAHAFLERALRITPYDNDLRDDCNRLSEKIRMDTLVAASAGKKG